MAEAPPPPAEPSREQLAQRLAALERSYAANVEALLRVQAKLDELVNRIPTPPKVIPWWIFVSFILAWGIIFHLLVR